MLGSRIITEEAHSHQAIEYSCNECGEEFEIFRDLAKHKRAAQCREEESDLEENSKGFEDEGNSQIIMMDDKCLGPKLSVL